MPGATFIALLVTGTLISAAFLLRYRTRKRRAERGTRSARLSVSELWAANETDSRLAKLDEMYASGWISRDEYERQRTAARERT